MFSGQPPLGSVWNPMAEYARIALILKKTLVLVYGGSELEMEISATDHHTLHSLMLGKEVKVTVDRPMGSFHPEHRKLYYPINYGYIEGILAPDGEEQDVYILGVDHQVKEFRGRIIGIVYRQDDIEEKWVAAPEAMSFTREQIWEQVKFQEQYFQSDLILTEDVERKE